MKPKFSQTNDAEREWIANSIACARTLVLASRPGGTDVGVRALTDGGDVLVCPASMVAKRWETKETNFLLPIYRAVIGQRNSIRDLWDSEKKSPWWKLW